MVRRVVTRGDEQVKPSAKEYDLLRRLVQHAAKVLTHRFLLSELRDASTDPQYLLTETGVGCGLRAPN